MIEAIKSRSLAMTPILQRLKSYNYRSLDGTDGMESLDLGESTFHILFRDPEFLHLK